MRIKLDYVTNSSSTSYALWAVTLHLNDFAEILGVKPVEDGWTADLDSDQVYELLEEIGLEFQRMDDDEWFVGLGPGAQEEDETLRAFKQRIVDLFREKLMIERKPEELYFAAGETYDG